MEKEEPKDESFIDKIEQEINENLKYVEYLPVYSFSAACGKFGYGQTAHEEGWMKVDIKRKLNPDMFIVKAVGRSMEPRINDSDYCIFEKDRGGTRDDKIVLVECRDSVDPDSGKYTIKEYLSEKIMVSEDATTQARINLIPLNKEYKTIVIDAGSTHKFKIVGWYIEIVKGA